MAGTWTEGGVTWNTQPNAGADHGTRSSSESPQEWDVASTVRARFPRGRVEFRVMDDAEGALLSALQEYASRGEPGIPPELVVSYEAPGGAALGCLVTLRQLAGSETLPLAIRVRRVSAPYQQSKPAALRAADGGLTAPKGVAYDPGRDALWTTDQAARRVRRYARATWALEQEYEVPEGFRPAGCAYDGEYLWLSDDASLRMTIRKFRIEASGLVEVATYWRDFRTVLAWDGAALWSADTIGGVVTRHRPDADLSVEQTFEGLPQSWGLAFSPGAIHAFTLEAWGDGYHLARRRRSDFELLESLGSVRGGQPVGLALVPALGSGHLVHADEVAGELVVRPSLGLASAVRPGNIPGSADLASSIRPGNVPGSAGLPSHVRANVPGAGILPSSARPRLRGAWDLRSAVRPRERHVTAHAPMRGTVATPVVVDAQDFLDISAEVGSSIVHSSVSGARRLRRVVQLVETRETESFPREVTSERGRASTQDLLRRGDAILFATGSDHFRPGDTVLWQGRTWVVVGSLGAEMVGDVVLYQEVGLRRLAVTTLGRLEGEVA